MNNTPSKAILGICGVILLLSVLSLVGTYQQQKQRAKEFEQLSADFVQIGQEMATLRTKVEMYEKEKAAASTTTATAATPAPATTPAATK